MFQLQFSVFSNYFRIYSDWFLMEILNFEIYFGLINKFFRE